MPESPMSIRANEETQLKFKELSESSCFKNQGDFLNHLITLYAAQESHLRVPILKNVISVVYEYADRLTNILVGTGEAIMTNQEKYQADSDKRKQTDAEKINSLNMDIENLHKQYEDLESECDRFKKRLEETDARIAALNAVVEDKTALNNSYMAQIESKDAQINKLTCQLRGIDNLHDELSETRKKAEEYRLAIEKITLDNERALIRLEKQLHHEAGEEQTRLRKEMEQLRQKADEGQASLRKEMEQERERHESLKVEYESRFIALMESGGARKTRVSKKPDKQPE